MDAITKAYKIYQDDQKINNNIYPDFYISYYSFINTDKVVLTDGTMDFYRYLIKMSCKKTKMECGKSYDSNNRLPVYCDGISLFGYRYKENTSSLDLYSYMQPILVWTNIRIKVGYDTDILSAFITYIHNIECIHFTLITAKASR